MKGTISDRNGSEVWIGKKSKTEKAESDWRKESARLRAHLIAMKAVIGEWRIVDAGWLMSDGCWWMAKTKSQKLKLTSIRDNPKVSITSEKITEHKT